MELWRENTSLLVLNRTEGYAWLQTVRIKHEPATSRLTSVISNDVLVYARVASVYFSKEIGLLAQTRRASAPSCGQRMFSASVALSSFSLGGQTIAGSPSLVEVERDNHHMIQKQNQWLDDSEVICTQSIPVSSWEVDCRELGQTIQRAAKGMRRKSLRQTLVLSPSVLLPTFPSFSCTWKRPVHVESVHLPMYVRG